MPSQTDPIVLARDLIACPSVTPQEGGALALLDRWLTPAGFAVERPVFSAPDTPDVENLFATIGNGERHLVFAGHTDVVPPGAEADWTHGPFAGVIADGYLYGRGAVDMKGGVAAFTAAALDFVAERGPDFSGRLSFLITGDEEGPAINGTPKLLDWAVARGERFSVCIVGEPTNPDALGDAIKVGRRGSLTGTVTLRGVQGHAAYPQRADNPIRGLPAVLEALFDPPLDIGNNRFEPTNLEVVSVDTGNPASNIIPAVVTLVFNVRFNDRWTVTSLKNELLDRLARAAGDTPLRRAGTGPLSVDVAFETTYSDVFLTHSPELIDTLSEAIEAVTGRHPSLSTGGGTSDARFIKNFCPVVEFGLVGQTMHQVDERVALADLIALKSIYRTFLDRYFP